jgi:SP family sugar:H+ symporter-like MFS transporter
LQFIPETKGLSLEQIDLMYRNTTVLKSNAYRRRILAEGLNDDETVDAYFNAAQDKSNQGVAGHHEHVGKRDLNEKETASV